MSSYPRILPSLSTSRPASCLSPHSTYQDYQHRKDQVIRTYWLLYFVTYIYFQQHYLSKGLPSVRHPDYDSSSRLCWPQNGDTWRNIYVMCKLIFCLDHQDSFGIKKERTVEETEYIDKKILMAERFFANGTNPLSSRWILKICILPKINKYLILNIHSYEEDRTCGSPQHQDPHNRIPPTRRHDLPVSKQAFRRFFWAAPQSILKSISVISVKTI